MEMGIRKRMGIERNRNQPLEAAGIFIIILCYVMWPWFLALLLFPQLFAFHALLLFTLCAMLTLTSPPTLELAEMLRHRILLLGRSVT